MNGSDNSWVIWLVAAGFFLYWLAQSNAASSANTAQTGVPPGSKVAGSTVYNAQGQVIGTVTSAGYYYPTIGSSGVPASSNPLTGTSAAPFQITPSGVPVYNQSGQLTTYVNPTNFPAGSKIVNGQVYSSTGQWLGETSTAGGQLSYTPGAMTL